MSAEEFKKLVELADATEDGKISRHELHKALRSAAVNFAGLRAWIAMRHIDTNGNRVIDGDQEFKSLIEYAKKQWNVR
ncbi:putative calcium-binding protein CML23 [Cocos nucifera]|uniref:Putative calcium-binding protein CML23 n=1 Tax=Cocos nucifera TaxID=13894 RepID=A0A8K0I821_COCNU|nr:putative calcium-binding protein CML23 [Cocos nucifera]